MTSSEFRLISGLMFRHSSAMALKSMAMVHNLSSGSSR